MKNPLILIFYFALIVATASIFSSCTSQGCTCSASSNFDPEATIDDGSCLGCTQPGADNYNSCASVNDGNCFTTVLGCTDQNSINFNAQANTDDGSCIERVVGCMDANAENFNPNANVDSGNCVFDTTGPEVESIDPANNAENIFVTRDIVVTFSETVNPTTLIPGQTVILTKRGSNTSIDGTINISGPRFTYRIPELELATNYDFKLTTGIEDLAGNNMEESFESTFKTSVPTERIPPTVISVSPNDGASLITYSQNVQIEFSETMDSESITSSNIKLEEVGGSSVATDITITSGKFVKLDPKEDLRGGGTAYRITITTGVEDLAGNNLEKDRVTTFTTVNDYVNEPSYSINEENVLIDEDVVLTFDVELDPSSINNSNVYIRPTTSDNGISSTLTVSGNKITIAPTNDLIEFETGYVVVIRNTIRDLRGNTPFGGSQFLFYTEKVSENYFYNMRTSLNNDLNVYARTESPYSLFFDSNGSFCNDDWIFDRRNDGTYTLTHSCTPSTQYLEGGPINGTGNMGPGIFTGQIWNLIKDTRTSNSTFYAMRNVWLGSGYSFDSSQLGMKATNSSSGNQYWRFVRGNRR